MVVELDTGRSYTIQQKFSLQCPGKLNISFQYAANPKAPVASSQLILRWNGAAQVITVSDYEVHTFSAIVDGGAGQNNLEIQGDGTNDGFGAAVSNVKVVKAPATLPAHFHLRDALEYL